MKIMFQFNFILPIKSNLILLIKKSTYIYIAFKDNASKGSIERIKRVIFKKGLFIYLLVVVKLTDVNSKVTESDSDDIRI